MSGLCGWASFAETYRPGRKQIADIAAKQTLHPDAHLDKEATTYCALATIAFNKRGYVYKDETGMVAIYGYLRIYEPRIKQLVHDKGIADALLELYQREGSDCLKYFFGHFSIALALKQQQKVLVAVDRMGVNNICYHFQDQQLLFAENAAALIQTMPESPTINEQAIYNYLYFHVVPGPDTIFTHIQRLSPGHFLELNGLDLTVGSYWQATFEREFEELNLAHLRDDFYTTLRASVQQECQSKPVGAFLSGGTDSSTVTGILREFSNDPVRTYSIGFEEPGYDEMEYARIAAKHFGAKHNEYYITPKDVVEIIPKIAASYGAPYGNSSAAPTYYCAAMAQADGMAKLLAGDGGDELFAGNERYATQNLFAKYQRIPKSLRENIIQPLLLGFPKGDSVPVLRKARSYVRQAIIDMPARMETYNHLERLGLDDVFERDFLGRVDTGNPLAMLTSVYESAQCETMLNRMLALDFKITLADNDLPKVNTMCELAGIEVGFPLLHDRMAQFANRLPVDLKLRRNRLRFFFKEALKDFLPQAILNKSKHGFGLPFGNWMIKHDGLKELSHDSLTNLKKRQIVRPEFIDRLLKEYMQEHPAYYGSMVWELMMLEQWFAHHVDQSGQSAVQPQPTTTEVT